jgi:cardiolipin synthase
MRMTAANILTLSRLVMVPLFVVAFVMGHKVWALVLFLVAGLTDLVDGLVARMLGQVSRGGAFLDPLADKLLMESCFLALALVGILPWWFFGIAFARDAMIMGGIIYLEKARAIFAYRPLWSSKLATVFQVAVGVLGLVQWWRPEGWDVMIPFFGPMLVVTTVLIVISWIQYFRTGLSLLRQNSRVRSS